MFLKSQNKNIYMISFFIIAIIIFIPFIIFDLKISTKLNEQNLINHWFSQTFDIYGRVCLFVPIYFCLLLFYFAISYKYFLNKSLKFFSYSFFQVLALLILLALNLNDEMLLNKTKNAEFISSCLFFIFIVLFCIYVNIWIYIKKYYKNVYWLNNMNKAASYFSLFMLMMTLNVELFKIIFGRPRPREVLLSDDFSFHYFFEINFSNNRGKSFPSGHTSAAGLMIGFSYFFYLDNKKSKNNKVTILIIFWTLTIATAISRMTKLAHFGTDVLFSMFMLVIYYYLAIIIMNKIERMLIKHG